MIRVAIQGYRGSFHDVVANNVWDNHDLVEFNTFDEVFESVQKGESDFGVVAIENSIAGAILENYDRVRDSGLKVIGEYYLRIVHNLLALPGEDLDSIVEVWSHPMALKQCQKFLDSHKSIKQIETSDTAGSVRDIAENELEGVAGIASDLAAKLYDMEIIKKGIETDPNNYTRFLLISKNDSPSGVIDTNSKKWKTSLYIETDHKPGALLRALQTFETFKFNMSMLVSRPIIGKPWEYGFYIDFEHGINDLGNFLDVLSAHTVDLRWLGTYMTHKQKQK